jgi:hypothetical protein
MNFFMKNVCFFRVQLFTIKQLFFSYISLTFIDEQSGFRSQHSCETSLNITLAAWKEMIEDSKTIVGVLNLTFGSHVEFERHFEFVIGRTIEDFLKIGSFYNVLKPS